MPCSNHLENGLNLMIKICYFFTYLEMIKKLVSAGGILYVVLHCQLLLLHLKSVSICV